MTKLYIPAPRPHIVARPRLIQRLDEGMRHNHRLTLISAPAGFGKTTVMSELARHPELSERASRLSAATLAQRRAEVSELQLVDVRNPGERELAVIDGALAVPLAELTRRVEEKLGRAMADAEPVSRGHHEAELAELLEEMTMVRRSAPAGARW